jgi:diaminopimelate epimerase
VSGRRVGFVKMSGAGNDFVVFASAAAARLGDAAAWAPRICRRGLSVGADGVVIVHGRERNRVRVVFHNPDGSVAFCGNGSRCAARFAHVRGLAGSVMVLETAAGEVPATVLGEHVRLALPPPRDAGAVTLEVRRERLAGRWILAGAPHFVVFVEDPGRFPLERWGPIARHHRRFGPGGVNVDAVGWAGAGTLAVRTWERGVERETLACGSGAVAAAFAAAGARRRTLRVVPASGIPLEVAFERRAGAVRGVQLTGDARFVFDARLDPGGLAGD